MGPRGRRGRGMERQRGRIRRGKQVAEGSEEEEKRQVGEEGDGACGRDEGDGILCREQGG